MWALAGGQWRVGFGGAYAMDWPAVAYCGRMLGIDIRVPRVLAGLRLLEREFLDQAERKRQQPQKA